MGHSSRAFSLRAKSAAVLLVSLTACALTAAPVLAQSSIPPSLTKLRPIKCIAYDPKPSRANPT